MEASTAIFALTNPSFFLPKPSMITGSSSPSLFGPCKQRVYARSTRLHCNKMFVPGFGEASPESKAASNMHHFFTYVAVKIVSAQLESYNPEAYKDLMDFLDKHSLNDGDKFCASLMRESPQHKALALRILEVRSEYCQKDFEWDNLQRLAIKMVKESNTRLMRDYVQETTQVDS
ncbi:Chaperonin-like RBCX protein 1, chloroplastic-like protein [Drosera capensis]